MIFKDKLGYVVNNETRNKTNTKNYTLLNDDFIYEATFKTNKIIKEGCVIGRSGGNMGIYVQPLIIKWCWFKIEDNNVIYDDIVYSLPENKVKQFTTVKVVKIADKFNMYINGDLYATKDCGDLFDYSNQPIYVGVGNPYSNDNQYWFNGQIKEVKIYHNSTEIDNNLYLWYNFEFNSKFKTFDISGNGNHGEIYESNEYKKEKNIEFNKLARPAKIV